uniref:MADF domain-containing protein n=1 Tax=Lygus hesperus TaxID=30085 RepID=A0A0A9YIG4_LYGHE
MFSNPLETSLPSPRLDVLQFLEEYKRFPCLWLRSDPDFRSREQRSEAYEYLLTRFNFQSIKEVKQKIRSLRGTYNQERSKVKKSMEFEIGSNDNDIKFYKPKLIWYDLADSFLRLNEQEQENESDGCVDSNLVTVLLTEPKREEESLSSDQLVSTTPPTPQPLASVSQSKPTALQPSQIHTMELGRDNFQRQYSLPTSMTTTNPTNKKRKRENGTLNRRNVARRDIPVDNAEGVPNHSASMNEFIVFGNHVASQLQTLPLEEALQLEADIQSLITSVRVRCLWNASSVKTEQVTTNSSASEDAFE